MLCGGEQQASLPAPSEEEVAHGVAVLGNCTTAGAWSKRAGAAEQGGQGTGFTSHWDDAEVHLPFPLDGWHTV